MNLLHDRDRTEGDLLLEKSSANVNEGDMHESVVLVFANMLDFPFDDK